MKRSRWKHISILTTFILALSGFPLNTVLADTADTQNRVTLTLNCTYENEPVADMPFDLYFVGDEEPDDSIDVADEFQGYAVDFTDAETDTNKSRELAETLDGYIERDHIPVTASGVTDQDGKLTLPENGSLEEGLYLCVGEQLVEADEIFTVEPFLVSLPQELPNGRINYEVVVNPKIQMSGIDVKDSTVDYSVIKVWEDSESADGTVGSGAAKESSQGNRPSQIQVQLVGDGEVKETVTLNAANNWRYTWKGLAASVDWKVVEKEVPEGYRVASELQDTTFVITNTEIPEEQEEPTTEQEEPTTEPTEPTTEPEQPTTQITEPSTEPATSAPKTAEIPEKLPQTGALRWPIPVLTVVGILLFTAGWFRYRRHAHGENAHEKKR